jgi:hypothetical protein
MIPYEFKREIVARGATRAVVHFSGGNDEGGADSIYLYNGDEKVAELEPYGYDSEEVWDDEKKQFVPNPDYKEDRLCDWLADIPSDRYGNFAGEFYVSGVITIDTITDKIAWSVDESTMQHSHWES